MGFSVGLCGGGAFAWSGSWRGVSCRRFRSGFGFFSDLLEVLTVEKRVSMMLRDTMGWTNIGVCNRGVVRGVESVEVGVENKETPKRGDRGDHMTTTSYVVALTLSWAEHGASQCT